MSIIVAASLIVRKSFMMTSPGFLNEHLCYSFLITNIFAHTSLSLSCLSLVHLYLSVLLYYMFAFNQQIVACHVSLRHILFLLMRIEEENYRKKYVLIKSMFEVVCGLRHNLSSVGANLLEFLKRAQTNLTYLCIKIVWKKYLRYLKQPQQVGDLN